MDKASPERMSRCITSGEIAKSGLRPVVATHLSGVQIPLSPPFAKGIKVNKFLIVFAIFVSLFICNNAIAETITLPNNTQLDISNLTDQEVADAIKLARKSIAEPSQQVVEIVKGIDPSSLDEWRKLITGTIKDVCNDLNVTVNEFVKTPVGMGVAALIVYKVAGKDLLENALDIVIMIPLWMFVTGFFMFLSWYLFSYKVVYQDIGYDDKGKKYKRDPKRLTRYDWSSHQKPEDSKWGVFWIMLVIEVILTIITLLIVLV